MTERRYLIEGPAESSSSAYARDLPGVAATGGDRERAMRDAGEALPEPSQLTAADVEIAA